MGLVQDRLLGRCGGEHVVIRHCIIDGDAQSEQDSLQEKGVWKDLVISEVVQAKPDEFLGWVLLLPCADENTTIEKSGGKSGVVGCMDLPQSLLRKFTTTGNGFIQRQ